MADYSDPNNTPYPPRRNMWDAGMQGLGGMFSGLRQNYLKPHSNKLLLGGLGMLGGGTADAMKGLVAGSALDTERKRGRALEALMNDPSSSLGNLSESDRAYLASNPDAADAVMAARMKPADTPGSWDEYVRTTSNPTEEGYSAFLDKKAASGRMSISLSQVPPEVGGKLGLAKLFIDELNVGSGGNASLRERIKATFGGENATWARAQLAAGRGEPTAIWRRAESGKEALSRILTGAGMMTSEMQQAIVLNGIRPTDDVKTMLDKMDWLEQQLQAVTEGVIGSRTGELVRAGVPGEEEGAADGGGTLSRDANGNLIWSP